MGLENRESMTLCFYQLLWSLLVPRRDHIVFNQNTLGDIKAGISSDAQPYFKMWDFGIFSALDSGTKVGAMTPSQKWNTEISSVLEQGPPPPPKQNMGLLGFCQF